MPFNVFIILVERHTSVSDGVLPIVLLDEHECFTCFMVVLTFNIPACFILLLFKS